MAATLLSPTAHAADCLAVPYSGYFEAGARPSCIDLTDLQLRLRYKEDSLSRARFWRSAMDYVPGAGPTVDLINQITGYGQDQRLTGLNASAALTRVLSDFRSRIRLVADHPRSCCARTLGSAGAKRTMGGKPRQAMLDTRARWVGHTYCPSSDHRSCAAE